MKHNRKNEPIASAWDTAPSTWSEEPATYTAASSNMATQPTPAGYVKYRAIYEFSARNADEITFQPGDIVMVSAIDLRDGKTFMSEATILSFWAIFF